MAARGAATRVTTRARNPKLDTRPVVLALLCRGRGSVQSALLGIALLGGLLLPGCSNHASQEDKQAAAQAAAARQQQADEIAAARKGIRAAEGRLDQLPPPSKARYLQVHSQQGWANPFLIVNRRTITLRIENPPEGTLPGGKLPGGVLHAAGPRKSDVTLRLIDLPEALAALPEDCWPYGRVVAVEEDLATPRPERPQMRRNVEAVMAMLNDLDVVVNEWPGGFR